jgi:hypothetical protein
MCRYIINILLVLLSVSCFAQNADTVDMKPEIKTAPDQQQLRFGIDITRPIINAFIKIRHSYEFQADYLITRDVYAVLEGGWGGSDIDYPDLRYTSSNSFVRIGVDKSMLQRMTPGDWDFLFVGFRYGIAFINRSEAEFTTADNFWGTTTGKISAKTFTGHWGEITLGLKAELLKGFFAGYTVRGKFLFNQGPFKELPPAFVAGYGKGEKNTIFDYNFYLSYALRWGSGKGNRK